MQMKKVNNYVRNQKVVFRRKVVISQIHLLVPN